MTTNVLVLGAGASRHYDFPLAYDIVQSFRNGAGDLAPQFEKFGIPATQTGELIDRLLRSGCTSVDQFAEYLERGPDIYTAKAIIAYRLALFEEPQTLVQKWGGGHWYELLANQLIGTALDNFPLYDIAIITFNYERSIEQYLLQCLTSRFADRHTPHEIRQAFLRLPIIHIYGRMGDLPGFSTQEGVRDYNHIRNRAELDAAVRGMHLLRELRDDPAPGERDAARNRLKEATGNVVFLGFAYAQENLEALNLKETCAGKTVFGTILNIGEHEQYKVLTERLQQFGVKLATDWRFDVYTAMLQWPVTILGPPRVIKIPTAPVTMAGNAPGVAVSK